MKIYITTSGSRSAYLKEMGEMFGLCSCENVALDEALRFANPQSDIIVLPAQSQCEGIELFLRRGGRVVAILPVEDLESAAGLVSHGESTLPIRLRFIEPLSAGSQGQSLWTLGSSRSYSGDGDIHVLAYLFQETGSETEWPGILETSVGDGSLTVFAYDPALCVASLRQGDPRLANVLPLGQPTPRAVFLQHPNQPTDTFWRPTADLHCSGFVGVLRRLLEMNAPAPTLWHLPNGAKSIVLFSGDEDAGKQEDNDAEMHAIESFGASMNLYVIPDMTSITRKEIDHYQQRGHTISVHPNLTDAADKGIEAQLRQAEAQVELFREKFGLPVRTLRNHCYMWPGYVELPELWERLGIGMDANATATLLGETRDFGPYAKLHAAMPMRYIREDGSMIDVFQQPTELNDDLLFHPSAARSHKYSLGEFREMVVRMLEEAITSFHSPICVNFHPKNYALFSGKFGSVLLEEAKERAVPVWSLDMWHEFWRARSTCRIDACSWDGESLRFKLSGSIRPGLTIEFPHRFKGTFLSDCKIDGEACEFTSVRRQGRVFGQILLKESHASLEIDGTYSSIVDQT